MDTVRLLTVVGLLGCVAKAPHFSTQTPRIVEKREQIPSAVRELVPRRGIYAAGGGLISSAWRVVVDLDAMVIHAGTGAEPGASSIDGLDREWEVPLSRDVAAALVAGADRAWREEVGLPDDPIVDYMELLILADGDEVRTIDGYGPIQAPESAALLDALGDVAGVR